MVGGRSAAELIALDNERGTLLLPAFRSPACRQAGLAEKKANLPLCLTAICRLNPEAKAATL